MGNRARSISLAYRTFAVLGVLIHDLRVIHTALALVILGITFMCMRKIPPYIRAILMKRRGKRFRNEKSLIDLPAGEKRKSIEFYRMLVDSFVRLVFWGILLMGIFLAALGANIHIHETIGFSEFRLSIASVMRFFTIILISLFLSRAVPIWLVSVLDSFIRNLMSLRDRVKEEWEEEISKDVALEGVQGGAKEGEQDIALEGVEGEAKEGEQDVALEGVQGGTKTGVQGGTKTEVQGGTKTGVQGGARDRADRRGEEDGNPSQRWYGTDRPTGEPPVGSRSQRPDPLIDHFITFLRWCILIAGFAYAIATLGLEPDSTFRAFNEDITVMQIVNATLSVLITVVFIIYFLPKLLNHIIMFIIDSYGKRHRSQRKRVEFITTEVDRLRPALHRTLVYLFILVGLLVSFSYLPFSFSFLTILLGITKALIVLAVAFILTILTPLIIYIQSPEKKLSRESGIYHIGRYINYLILLIAGVVIIGVIGVDLESSAMIGETRLSGWNVITALLVMVITVMVAKMIVAMLRDTVLHPDTIDRHAAHVLERLTYITIIIIGMASALGFLGVNIFAVMTGLGLVGFALAFGMQDTIANFMAGIMIAVERPFKIGDYIRVGNEWGHVVDIGMRSTKILTIQNELVTIPNNRIATGEVWNFTRNNPLYVLHVPIGISYDSDWHRAEEIILAAALSHKRVLKHPTPKVMMTEYGDSSINLKLVAWINHAKFRMEIKSDLLKRIKDDFDARGIEIPYPYRTIVFKRDMREGVGSPNPELRDRTGEASDQMRARDRTLELRHRTREGSYHARARDPEPEPAPQGSRGPGGSR